MCCETKEIIAECVKNLMKKKEIKKITVHNIMDESHMSRQTFYYNFKDIYDVLEWIYKHNIVEPLSPQENCTVEEWISRVSLVIAQNYVYVSHVVKELEWPKICTTIKPYMTDCLMQVLDHPLYSKLSLEQKMGMADFLAASYSYYLMDCLYYDKPTDEKTISDEYTRLCQLFSLTNTDMIEREGFHILAS